MAKNVKFNRQKTQAFAQGSSKDADTIYFTNDTNQVVLGGKLMGLLPSTCYITIDTSGDTTTCTSYGIDDIVQSGTYFFGEGSGKMPGQLQVFEPMSGTVCQEVRITSSLLMPHAPYLLSFVRSKTGSASWTNWETIKYSAGGTTYTAGNNIDLTNDVIRAKGYTWNPEQYPNEPTVSFDNDECHAMIVGVNRPIYLDSVRGLGPLASQCNMLLSTPVPMTDEDLYEGSDPITITKNTTRTLLQTLDDGSWYELRFSSVYAGPAMVYVKERISSSNYRTIASFTSSTTLCSISVEGHGGELILDCRLLSSGTTVTFSNIHIYACTVDLYLHATHGGLHIGSNDVLTMSGSRIDVDNTDMHLDSNKCIYFDGQGCENYIQYDSHDNLLELSTEGNLSIFGNNSIKIGANEGNINFVLLDGYAVTCNTEIHADNGFFQTSDIRKKNVLGELDLNKAYDLIDKCQTILYSLKDNPDRVDIGLIAQEVQQFFPEIVSEDNDGMLSLDYAKLTVVILRVLKDLIARVSKLESK